MSKMFTYYFYNRKFRDEEPYDYEPDYLDMKDYVMRTHDHADIIEDFIDTGLYALLPNHDQETLKSYDGFDGTSASIAGMSKEAKEDLADEIIYDIIMDTDIYDDELADYFEDEAAEAYNA